MKAEVITRVLCAWIGLIVICILLSLRKMSIHNNFFHFGPSKDLILFGIPIDNVIKYTTVCIYTILSTIVRTLQQEVISPWIIQNIQNDTETIQITKDQIYFIVIVDVIYRWVDWFMYMNILLIQVDFMILEIVGNIATSTYTTNRYMKLKKKNATYNLIPSEIF